MNYQHRYKKIDVRFVAWAGLAVLYLLIRFILPQTLDALGGYASYYFEIALVGIATLFTGKSFLRLFQTREWNFLRTLGAGLAGFAVYRLAVYSDIAIPFDLRAKETIVLLLVVAPLLEELIFRFFLWQPIAWLTNQPILAWFFTSLLFSYAHFHAYWFAPPELYKFVLYQTLYTLPLGFACGYCLFQYRSLRGAMLVHLGFNLGFFVASFF